MSAASEWPLDCQWPAQCSLVGFSPTDASVTSHVASCGVKHPMWEKLYHSPWEPFPCRVSLILTVFRKTAVIQFTPLRTVFHQSGQCSTVTEVAACIASETLPVSVCSNVAVFTTLSALLFISPLYTVSALNYGAKAAHMAALGLNRVKWCG